MPDIHNIIKGLQIIEAHLVLPDDYICAEHDIIYAPKANLSKEDVARLEKLRWFFDDDTELWAAFV